MKRFWTGDLYCLYRKGRWQAPWMKEEPPSQKTRGVSELELLPELEDEEIITQLTALKGVGRWTAEMCLIFTFARCDVLPVDDLGFLEGVRVAYQLPARPSKQEIRERGELWRPYRTFATWYMWAIRRLVLKNERPRTRIVSL